MRTVEPNGIRRGSAAAIPTRVCAPDAVSPRLQYAVAVNGLARAGFRGVADVSTAMLRNASASATTKACFIDALRVQRVDQRQSVELFLDGLGVERQLFERRERGVISHVGLKRRDRDESVFYRLEIRAVMRFPLVLPFFDPVVRLAARIDPLVHDGDVVALALDRQLQALRRAARHVEAEKALRREPFA